ncbi:DNA polymerase I B, chloroplastic/mitochondrial-like isoform X1 [Camellia sinensis]|uniref:DNA polymerase I B, chloroplastic/mitochondrial-like isoform X1 n=1 Tax=Camellia sinensis TaxID=4442 RepID=UPI0010355555|nr:DNA polymerase I B, chloroplastic/mitochondrial-like isoform X1 [Camellia sinensis]
MAMGVSTQTTHFKPFSCFFPPLFWVSSSTVSSRSFWTSSRKTLHRKVFHRQGDCALHNVAGSLSNMVVFSISFHFKQGSSYNTMSFDEKYRQDDMELYLPSAQLKFVVPVRASYASNSFARMLPDLPNQINSKGNSFSGGFGSPQRLEEEKKQGDYQRASASSAAGILWLDEKNKLFEEKKKLRNMGMAGCSNSENSCRCNGSASGGTTGTIAQSELEALRDGSAYVPAQYFEDSCFVEDDNTSREIAFQSPFGQGYIGDDQINLPVHSPAQKPNNECNVKSERNTSFVPGLINEDLASCMPTYVEVSISDNNKQLTKSSSKQYSRNSAQSNVGNGALRSSTVQRQLVNPIVPRISPPPYEPVSQQQKYSGNGKGHDSMTKGRVLPHYLKEQDLSLAQTSPKDIQPKGSSSGEFLKEVKEINSKQLNGSTSDALQKDPADGNVVGETSIKPITVHQPDPRKRVLRIYDKVLVVDNISMARKIVRMLTNQYRHCVHACDTEVANIDVKQETPVNHGEIICFSIYPGPEANFGDGKSCIWVDVLDGGSKDLLVEFAPFFEDPSIKKVWHNYSFDKHVIENYGFKVSGFHADTMHMARLWDSSRRTEGGYSLEALSGDPKVCCDTNSIGKISMKTIFGRKKVKKDGSDGKLITIPPVEELQREERKPWICYSALDSMSTLNLYESLKSKLSRREWKLGGNKQGSMFDFYEKYWRPFGELLVELETDGMLVDRAYLAEMEKVARAEQQIAANRFRSWASKYCPEAKYMNVGSDAQLRQLFFGGIQNRKDTNEFLPEQREFKIPNVEKVIEEGKKTPTKFRNIKLHSLVSGIEAEIYTASGWPSVSGDALKTLAGKVSAEFDFTDDSQSDDNIINLPETKLSKAKVGAVSDGSESAYGTAYAAFGGGQNGKEACHAIAALCEVCSIDSLISNFILPLQGSHISGKNGRIHCSLNINTETGRLSARRPNLQNQPALEKDRYKIRQAFIAMPGNSLIVADYGQLELRILAHLANCKSMLDAFRAGGDFHSRTAMNMYPHIREAVEQKRVLLEWHPQPGEEKPPVPLLKDAFGSERRKAKMLNFSIAYGKTPVGLARDWKVSVKEAKETVNRWYNGRKEVRDWQEERKKEARQTRCVHTLLGRARRFPSMDHATPSQKGHIERAAINTPVQGSAADVAMCAMLEISRNSRLKELGWRLLLQVHDEVILEGPTESAEDAKIVVVECMSKPFDGKNILNVGLSVDAKCAQNWYSAK